MTMLEAHALIAKRRAEMAALIRHDAQERRDTLRRMALKAEIKHRVKTGIN